MQILKDFWRRRPAFDGAQAALSLSKGGFEPGMEVLQISLGSLSC
jgi:hypothetical protein